MTDYSQAFVRLQGHAAWLTALGDGQGTPCQARLRPSGQAARRVELLYNTSENHKKIAVAVQSMWKAVGVERHASQ
jgi:hypothetical protein